MGRTATFPRDCQFRRRLAGARRAVLSFSAAAVLLALMAAGPGASAGEIVIQGNRRIEAADIRSRFPADPQRGFDAAAIDAGIKALYATGLFTDVKVTRSADRLVVTVSEAPVIDRVQFEGNKNVKDKQLTDEVQSKPRGPFSQALVQSDVSRIVEIYRRSGRYDVRVVPKTIARGEGRVDLVFEVTEGAKTAVKTIAFSGNNAFPAWRLKGVLKTRESWLLSFLTSADIYDPDRIEADRDLLRRFYLNNGYADVSVTAAGGEYDPAAKGFQVTFVIEEGPQFRFGKVDISSRIPAVDASKLPHVLRMSSGQIFNADAVEKTSDDLTVAITKSGYPFAVVRPQINRDAVGKVVHIAYVLEEGTRTYIERINVHGNEWTRDYVILREFDIGEGDAYNRNLIDRAERRLKRLRFFKTVKITTEPGSTPDRIVVDVAVEEDKTADLNFGVGYSTVDGVLGEVSVSERNLLGTGISAKIALTAGQYVKGATIGFVEPYFLGSRASLGLDVFGKQTDVSSYQSYGSEIYGTTVKLAAPLTEEIGVEGRYSIYRQGTSLAPNLMDCSPSNPPPGCYANGEASAPTKQAVLDGPAWVSMVGSTLTYSTLDNPLDPHSGVRADLKQDVAGLGGDVRFLRMTEDVRYYQPITSDITGIGRVQGGYIAPWGGQTVPLASSFFGGPTLVRGFAPNGFGPRDLTSGTTMDNVGGSRYWATSAELQAPIPYLPPDFALKGAIFADAGSVFGYNGPALSSSFALADSGVVRSSIGAGLIWSSPFGPLRVDYAFPITKTSYDVTQRLRFGAGPF